MPEFEATDSPDNSVDSPRELSRQDIQKIKEGLVRSPETAFRQLGKFNITIGHGSEIRIGDTITQSLDENSLRALVTAIKDANESTEGKVYKHLKKLPLETIDVNFDKIEKVNLDLESVNNLERQGYLTDTQKVAFSALKKEVHSLNEFNRRLEELQYAAKSLLDETRLGLVQKIEELKQQGEELLDTKSLDRIAKEEEYKVRELKILESFIEELEESEKIAEWINNTRKNVAKRFGREALKSFPDIEKNIEPNKVSDFCFSIYQFLEQIAHCLKWGIRDILDSPDILLVLDYPVYEKAFLLIRDMISKNMHSRFNQKSRDLACECIDHLVFQLPFYERE
ncbi:MAG: hypothetical protein AAFW75_08200 [Cyanobacteria bacterium J06636_16]